MRFLTKLKKILNPSKPRKVRVFTPKPGEVYNLQEIYNQINLRYFKGEVDATIEWSKKLTKQARSYRRLGSYNPARKRIRINPLLDSTDFPPYFISYIVYHEILHHVYPPFRKKGKWHIHHPAFKKMEKEFDEYALAKEWEKNNKTLFFNR